MRSKNKLKIMYGSIFALLMFVFIFPITVSADIVPPCNPTGAASDGMGPALPACNFNALMTLMGNIMVFAIDLGLAAVSIAFAYAGFLYITSNGDSGKVKQAHEIFRKVVIGAFIALSATVLVNLLLSELHINQTILERLPSWFSR
jgi:hypothetical protein